LKNACVLHACAFGDKGLPESETLRNISSSKGHWSLPAGNAFIREPAECVFQASCHEGCCERTEVIWKDISNSHKVKPTDLFHNSDSKCLSPRSPRMMWVT
jgi:hypothetical protein